MSTPFKVKLPAIPLFAGTIFFVNCAVTYSLYGLENRFQNYFPTVSETAIGFFNTQYFSSAMAFEAYFVLIAFYLIIVWGETWNLFPKWFITVGQIISFLIPLFMIGVGDFPYADHMIAHFVFAIGLFVMMWLFNVAAFFILWKKMHGCIFATRIILLIISTVCIILFISSNYIQAKGMVNLNGISEVIFISSVIIMVLTWFRELTSIDATFFIEE